VVLIDCAQRLMDDKQLATQPAWMGWIRPLLKTMVSQRWLSTALFRNAARPGVIRSVLKQAYPVVKTSTMNSSICFINQLKGKEQQKHFEALSTSSTTT